MPPGIEFEPESERENWGVVISFLSFSACRGWKHEYTTSYVQILVPTVHLTHAWFLSVPLVDRIRETGLLT